MDAEIYSLLADIQAEAINASVAGRAQVFVDYAGHVNCLSVYAWPAGTVYRNGSRDGDGAHVERLMNHSCIPLDRWDAWDTATKLTAIRDEIRALGVEEAAG